MNRNPLIRFTKFLLDFMFYTGIIVCIAVPAIFKTAGEYNGIFEKFYLPFCILFMIAGVFAIIILWELRMMFKTVLAADPFVMENAKALKIMGTCAFAIAVLMTVRLFFVITLTALVLILVFVVAGLFSLVLSQVFEQAVNYKQENDLTI